MMRRDLFLKRPPDGRGRGVLHLAHPGDLAAQLGQAVHHVTDQLIELRKVALDERDLDLEVGQAVVQAGLPVRRIPRFRSSATWMRVVRCADTQNVATGAASRRALACALEVSGGSGP